MWRSRLWLLYWVSTAIRRWPPLTRLESAMSTSRYTPPKGTAGLARSLVSGDSRLPSPPARTMAKTLGMVIVASAHRGETGADHIDLLRAVADEPVALEHEVVEVLGVGVVHGVGGGVELDLEAVVVLRPQDLEQLVVGGVAHPVEDDVEDGAGPLQHPPVAHLLV